MSTGFYVLISRVHVVQNSLDDTVEIFFLVCTDFRATFGSRYLGCCFPTTCRSPDCISDVLVFLVHQKTKHRGLNAWVQLPKDEIALRLRELPVFLVVSGVELQVNHEIGRFEVTLGKLVFV